MAQRPIAPGAADLLRRSRINTALKAVAKKHDMLLRQVIQEQMDLLIDDLRVLTPIDTGAGAGTTQGAKRDLYKSHPAFKMKLPIGNFEGASGWQPYSKVTGKHWAVINPMWDAGYLKALNYNPTYSGANFLEEAVRRWRSRLMALANKRGRR